MRRPLLAAACVLAVACGPRATPSNTKAPDAGISIALYRSGTTSYGVVDDRRWVEISGTSILLANIDPGASLASLVIETANPKVRIGPCTRERLPDDRDGATDRLDAFGRDQARRQRDREYERMPRRYRRPVPVPAVRSQVSSVVERFAPIVQCDVAGASGRYLVRIVYVSTALAYRVQHDIEVRDPTKATIESRFAMRTPPWRERAEVALFDGVPGGIEPPREIMRGMVTLDGGTSVLIVPARELPAQLRRVFEGLPFDASGDEEYAIDTLSVWATLEVPNVELVPGPIRVHVDLDGEDRWIDLPMKDPDLTRFADAVEAAEAAEARDKTREDAPLRIKLWIDQALRGARQRMIVENDGVRMVEVIMLTMTNTGDTVREVWLEEHARPAKRRQIDRPWPKKPSASGDTIRNKVEIKPGRVERMGYTIIYEMR